MWYVEGFDELGSIGTSEAFDTQEEAEQVRDDWSLEQPELTFVITCDREV